MSALRVRHSGADIHVVMEDPPYHVDIDGVEETESTSANSLKGRPWVGIYFDCCGVYARVYRTTDGTAYHGRCPRCLRKIKLRVGSGGTDARFFTAE